MDAKEQTLTLKQAVKQGYSKVTHTRGEWTFVTDIEDLTDEDFEENSWWLCEKDPKSYSVSIEDISELISGTISQQESDENGRDDDRVYDVLKKIDYSDIVNKINSNLKEHCAYYTLAGIRLVK